MVDYDKFRPSLKRLEEQNQKNQVQDAALPERTLVAIDITAGQRKTILALLERYLPGTAAWAFGSRMKWTARAQVDFNLVVFATHEQNSQVGTLREAFEESDLPFRVNLSVWEDVSEAFREQIVSEHMVFVGKGECNHSNLKWPVSTIGEVSEKVAMGPFGSAIKVETFVPEGVPIISGKHLHGARVDDTSGFNFITEEHARRLANANVRRGDIVFTHAGNIGQAAYIPEHSEFSRYVISQRQFYMRCDRFKAIPEYIVTFFKSPEGQHKLLANASQVGVPSIARPVTYLRTVEIPLPTLPEQRAIAHILGTLDDKIELNRRMNETLEAMARAFFKSWFVDFDPVRAKAALKQHATNHSPPPHQPTPDGASSATPLQGGSDWAVERARAYLDQMDPKIADLFPDSLVDSELGKIPEGWDVMILGDLLELTYGKALKSDNREQYGDIPVYGSNGQVGWHNMNLVRGPGIIVGRKGNPGTVTWAHSNFFPIDTTFYVVPRNDKDILYFLYFALKSQNLSSLAADSAVPGLNRNLAYMNRQVTPAGHLIESFNNFVFPIFSRSHDLEAESCTLTSLRDTLLPKLISGELRVKEAEIFFDRIP